jgi:acyl-[acyl-carrier-protein]-phospholipid O-acyltransferase/long-chain-fatty-acid--[acyl-carrier-protein] ligase
VRFVTQAAPDVATMVRPLPLADLPQEVAGGIFALLGLAAVVAVFWLFPAGVFRLALWLVAHSVYWLRVRGQQQVPAQGPVLLLCNAESGLDWMFLLVALRRRVRCVRLAGWARQWPVRHLLRWADVIVIDGSADARAAVRALRQARQALLRGETVCLFTSSHRLRGGLDLPFHRIYRRVLRGTSAPVVPVCLLQRWSTLFEVAAGKLRWKWPQLLPYPVEVTVGAPLPAGTEAGDARQAVEMLEAAAAVARVPRLRPVHRQFVRTAARHPFRLCMLDSTMPERRLSYARTLAGAMCLARLLRPLLGDAPMVAVWLPSSLGGALVNITLALLGKTSVNLNYTAAPDAIRSALRQCGSRHVLTSHRFLQRLPLDPGPDTELCHLEDLLPQVGALTRALSWLAVVVLPGWVLEYFVLGLGRHRVTDLATIIFSSGSTGEPKGVMLSHGNIAANAESMIQVAAVSPRDRILGVLPFFHSFGYTVTLWTPLQVGASTVYHPDPRAAKEIGELCRTHRSTIYVSTATFLRFCLRKCDADDFRSLRLLICGAEKLPVSLSEEFAKKFGILPLEGYGCTELAPVTATNLSDLEVNGLWQINNRPGTIGPPIDGIVARVVDPDTRAPRPVGSEGLLLIYGGNVMQGYLGRPDLTREALHEGWYVTGDMARLDADGFLTLTGRLSRFAKCGGEMVPLEKIEEVLHEILATTERVCAVTCVPDEARGERLVVLYLAQNGVQVRDWCQQLSSRGLPNLWVPAERDFHAVPELPLLGSGKLNLQAVKQMAMSIARR